jgi:glycine/D-amino acid oxidase-like deaminating enzyme
MPRSVIVVGGGIIGCSIAYELAKAGCRVTMLERSTPGAEASSAAAGLLAPLGGSPNPDPFRELALASWRLYPAVVLELRELTGVDVGHMTGGTLYPLFGPGEIEAARLRTKWNTAAEFGIEVLDGSAALEREPALSKDMPAALFVKGDHWVNNQRLPWAPDYAPILGPWPGAEGLVIATAHYRNGILLAPVTAALISRCVLTGKTPAALEPFLPQRFLSKET